MDSGDAADEPQAASPRDRIPRDSAPATTRTAVPLRVTILRILGQPYSLVETNDIDARPELVGRRLVMSWAANSRSEREPRARSIPRSVKSMPATCLGEARAQGALPQPMSSRQRPVCGGRGRRVRRSQVAMVLRRTREAQHRAPGRPAHVSGAPPLGAVGQSGMGT